MRSTCSIITRTAAFLLCLMLTMPAASASSLDEELTLGIISVKTTRLNPLLAEERDFQVLTPLLYESLITLDDNYMPQPCVAESWEMSSDASKWTFYLKENINFHTSDGQPLRAMTAYDIKATLDEILRLAQEGKGQYASLQYLIKSVSASNSTTLTITSKRPYYGFLFAMTFPILPAEQVQTDNPAGSGPYIASAFAPRDYLYLTVSDDWRHEASRIKRINVVFTATTNSLIGSYENNEVDAIITRSASASQYSRTTTSFNLTYRTQQLETMLINNHALFLDDINVRKAIRYAVNVDALAQAAYQGMAQRTDTPLPNGTWMYQDDDAFEYNVEKAKKLLADSGWTDPDGDKVLNKVIDGKERKLHLQLYVYEEQDNSVRVETANMIAGMLAQIGIEVKVTNMTFSEASQKLQANNFDLCLAAFQMDGVPDPGFLLMKGNTHNFGRYSSKDMDSLFKSLRTASDFDSYKNYLHQIQTQFAKDCPFICLYYRSGSIMTRKLFTFVRDVREPDLLRGIESYHP